MPHNGEWNYGWRVGFGEESGGDIGDWKSHALEGSVGKHMALSKRVIKEPFKNVEVMNSAKLQHKKTQLYFYTLEMSNQLRKLRKKFYL